MANKQLENRAISLFCENMAMLLGAGISAEEAAGLLAEDSAEGLQQAAAAIQKHLLVQGGTLAEAVETGGFYPLYVSKMLAAGERSGRTVQVLNSLAGYYDAQDRLQARLKSAVLYPLVLLLLMAAILAVLLARVMPVFTGVYASLSGSLTASSYRYIAAGYVFGGAALAVTALLAAGLVACVLLGRTPAGRETLARRAVRLPFTAPLAEQNALCDFLRVLQLYIASGMDEDAAMTAAAGLVTHPALQAKAAACLRQMRERQAGLATALYDQKLLEPLYGRMLVAGARSGNLEQVLARLTGQLWADTQDRIDHAVDSIEPALSAFLTVAVGVTLVSAMLPLVGILGSIA